MTSTLNKTLIVGAGIAAYYLIQKFMKKREYNDKQSVGSEYDSWTADGVLEYYWGEHIHHGYYPDKSLKNVDFKESKIDMIERLLSFADISKVETESERLNVLDVGCGIGGSSRHIAKTLNANCTGITLSPAQVARGTQLNNEANLNDQVTLQVADALNMPFEDNTFDFIWSCESGEHMPDKEKFVNEMLRVLKPNGKLLIVTWCTRDVENKSLDTSENKILSIIYREWALPFFISVKQYVEIFNKYSKDNAEFEISNLKTDDWSDYAMPTWPHSVLEGAKKIYFLIACGPIIFFRTLRDVYAIYYMDLGYRTNLICYGLITVQKSAKQVS